MREAQAAKAPQWVSECVPALCRQVDSRFASDLSTFIKLCCGGVSPPLNSTYVGIVADVFLVITASFACFQRAGPRITAFACTSRLLGPPNAIPVPTTCCSFDCLLDPSWQTSTMP